MPPNTTFSVSFSTDIEGFLTQECPHCYRKFKVKFEQGGGKMGFCPYCSKQANDWWTREQQEYLNAEIQNKAINPLLKGLNSEFFKVKPKNKLAIPPIEKEGLKKFEFSCCREMIKILENWDKPLTCIICGKTSV